MIRVKYAPSAAIIGESAYTIGRGEKRERDKRFATDVGLKLYALSLQEERIESSDRYYRDRNIRREEELGFRREQWEEEPGRQLQKSLEAQKRLQENVAYEYSQAQLMERARIIEGIAWIDAEVIAKRMLPEDAEDLSGQMWAKYYGIHSYPIDKGPSVQEKYESGFVKHPITGKELWVDPQTGKPQDLGPTFADRAKAYIGILSALKMQDMRTTIKDKSGKEIENPDLGKVTIDTETALLEYSNFMTIIKKEDGLEARVEEIKARQQRNLKRAADDVRKVEMQEKVEALPEMFEKITPGQPKIGRKKKGPPTLFADDVYGEEAYKLMLAEATQRGERMGIAPDVMKAEFDKWWDEQYDKHRGKATQTFGNRMEFSKSAPAPPAAAAVPKKELTKKQAAIDYVKSILQYGDYAELSDKARRDIGVKMLAESGFEVTADELKLSARKAAPAKRTVVPEVDMTKLDEIALSRIQKFKSGKIVWSAISKKYGQETSAELKYIIDSGNEQAIANALKRLGII